MANQQNQNPNQPDRKPGQQQQGGGQKPGQQQQDQNDEKNETEHDVLLARVTLCPSSVTFLLPLPFRGERAGVRGETFDC